MRGFPETSVFWESLLPGENPISRIGVQSRSVRKATGFVDRFYHTIGNVTFVIPARQSTRAAPIGITGMNKGVSMEKRFYPPKFGYVFKRVFGDQRNIHILAVFLRAVLDLDEADCCQLRTRTEIT
jgi:hypothetical protein